MGIVAKISHVLLVKPEWLELILQGRKQIELRGNNTHKRGLVGLGYKDQLLGHCHITGSRALTADEVESLQHLHFCPPDLVKYPTVYAWTLEAAERLSAPQKLERKRGQVIWVCQEFGAQQLAQSESSGKNDLPSPSAPPVVQVQEQALADRIPEPPGADVSTCDNGSNLVEKAKCLRAANAGAFLKLLEVAPKFFKEGSRCARGRVPSVVTACSLCDRNRHSCMWELKRSKQGVVTSGGVCYACVRSCKLLGSSRSATALKQVGLTDVIRTMSAWVSESLDSDLCQCCAPECQERRTRDVE